MRQFFPRNDGNDLCLSGYGLAIIYGIAIITVPMIGGALLAAKLMRNTVERMVKTG